jgi:hypothetical protein
MGRLMTQISAKRYEHPQITDDKAEANSVPQTDTQKILVRKI